MPLPSVTILIVDKVEFNKKSIARDKRGQFIMMKGSIHQEAVTTMSVTV